MKTNTTKRIIVGSGVQAKLASLFGCTTPMVCNALSYKRESDLAARIRHLAVKDFGGKEVELTNIV